MKTIKVFILFVYLFPCFSKAQTPIYFPPASPQNWDTLSPSSLNWCNDRIDSLYDYLQQKNTKSFIILKNGKIVLEKYFGTFTADSLWYWASAGKTLTSFLTGIAQSEGALNIHESASQYLGNGWSSCTTAQEDSIKILNLLTMTSGLNDNNPPPCTTDDDTPACLTYLADPGTRWAYHNGAYRKLQDLLPIATGIAINSYTNTKVKSKIFMSSGTWVNNVFYSKTRDAARFGLLCLNKGIWDNTLVLNDSVYFNAMTNTSQNINLSYGYLTWLNGKSSFMLPVSQQQFNGAIIPNAPFDMYAALGKNDQKIYIVPSQNMVVVRMGQSAYSSSLAITIFDNELWQKINELDCSVTSTQQHINDYRVYPNPFTDYIRINALNKDDICELINTNGQIIYSGTQINQQDFTAIPKGIYFLKINKANQINYLKLVKL